MFLQTKKQALEVIRANWGKEKNTYFHPDSVRIYFDQRATDASESLISDRVAHDLDLDRIFPRLDRTSSKIGRQFLYDQLRRPCLEAAPLEQFAERVTHFQQAEEERTEIQYLLNNLNRPNDYYFPLVIFGDLPGRPSWLSWVHLLRGVVIGSLVLLPFYPAAFWALALVLPLNLFLHYQNKHRVGKYLSIFERFQAFCDVGSHLLPYLPEQERTETSEHLRRIRSVLRHIRWIKLDRLQHHEAYAPIWFVVEVLKFLTLSELIGFYKVLEELDQYRADIHQVYRMIGGLDSAISVASYRTGLPYFQTPNFLPAEKRIRLEGALHPLLTDGVANDLGLDGKSMLLTGSNMSGKTTFIRTVGLNAILAQTIMTPICTRYEAPFLRIGTSIRIQDDVESDKSYYLEEVMVIGDLIREAGQHQPQLFIIDEMFKGTNTLERVSAARAVLSYLNQGSNIVLISTHDIELTDHLSDAYELYYFQESVENEQLLFDYRLKKGRLQQKNAIKILEIMGYPEEIIQEANQLAGSLDISKAKS